MNAPHAKLVADVVVISFLPPVAHFGRNFFAGQVVPSSLSLLTTTDNVIKVIPRRAAHSKILEGTLVSVHKKLGGVIPGRAFLP